MLESSRLIVVSNRLPVSLVKEQNEWKAKRSSGGLATAMDPILKQADGIWIGWSGTQGDETPEALKVLREEQSCIAVDMPADLIEDLYGNLWVFSPSEGNERRRRRKRQAGEEPHQGRLRKDPGENSWSWSVELVCGWNSRPTHDQETSHSTRS
jgi:hypothetical protein